MANEMLHIFIMFLIGNLIGLALVATAGYVDRYNDTIGAIIFSMGLILVAFCSVGMTLTLGDMR